MSCIRSCYDKDSSNFEHDDCKTCIHGDRPQQRTAAEGEDTRRAWVGLTDEEIYTESRNHEKWAKDGSEWFSRGSFARAIEARLKEKNT